MTNYNDYLSEIESLLYSDYEIRESEVDDYGNIDEELLEVLKWI